MNTLIWVVVIAFIVFLLTYDPKKGVLNKYIVPDAPQGPQASQASKEAIAAPESQCSSERYYEVQFNGKAPPGECSETPKQFLGAVI
jgi:hypothetical protein